jgi:hypothetical protein
VAIREVKAEIPAKWSGRYRRLPVKRKSLGALVLVVTALFSGPLFAHHGSAGVDMTKKVVVKGVVTEWRWQNPHSILKFDAKADDGSLVHWSAETNNPADMVEKGWTAKSIKVGDEVTVTLHQVKNGLPVGTLVQVAFPDGRTLDTQYKSN